MTLDKTLQRIIQRAEFDVDRLHDFWLCQTTEDDIESAKFENSRLKPIIQGLCEEVQRLQNCVEGFQQLIDDAIFIRDRTIPIMEFHKQTTRVRAHFAACHSTSALEKLGGGDD